MAAPPASGVDAPLRLKCVVVGDGAVGKTSMLKCYTGKEYPVDYAPTVLENFVLEVVVGGRRVQVEWWDTAGQEAYDRLRLLCYPHSTCFLACFCVADRSSLDNLRTKWVPEIKHHRPGCPFIIVGTKVDKRNATNLPSTTVRFEEGEAFAAEVGADGYMETSSLNLVGLKPTFDAALRTSIKYLDTLSKPTPAPVTSAFTCTIL